MIILSTDGHMKDPDMRILLVCLALLLSVCAFPSEIQTRLRKSHPQDVNIQPFIRFRKASYNSWIDPLIAYH
ncbi:hypothetical protein GCK32_007905 [Trichostrongylus colubriformis]|uniref:Uncharacterized protein n=1 Tax=Trichostrongylus colubriformis TaxID=6319 RepID=A0AAN8FZJ0_TRICO